MARPTASRTHRRGYLVLGLLAVLLVGCPAEDRPADRGKVASSPGGGIGGTGAPPRLAQGDGQGIGGTGISPNDRPDDGIGGTGAPARSPDPEDQGIGGTGIVGTITGFGSIIVNGHKIEYDASLPVSSVFGAGSPGDLRVGQVVAVRAEERNGRLHAKRLEIRYPVAGPVTGLDPATGRARILRQWVQVGTDTRMPTETADAGSALQALRLGETVRVSGLRRPDGVLEASRIERAPDDRQASVTGPVDKVDDRGFAIGDLRVDWPASAGPRPKPGQQVRIVGRHAGLRLAASRVSVLPERPFGGRVRRLSIEGFADVHRGGGFTVGGFRVRDGKRFFQGGPAGGRVIVNGEFDRARQFRARRLRILKKFRNQTRRARPVPPDVRRGSAGREGMRRGSRPDSPSVHRGVGPRNGPGAGHGEPGPRVRRFLKNNRQRMQRQRQGRVPSARRNRDGAQGQESGLPPQYRNGERAKRKRRHLRRNRQRRHRRYPGSR